MNVMRDFRKNESDGKRKGWREREKTVKWLSGYIVAWIIICGSCTLYKCLLV